MCYQERSSPGWPPPGSPEPPLHQTSALACKDLNERQLPTTQGRIHMSLIPLKNASLRKLQDAKTIGGDLEIGPVSQPHSTAPPWPPTPQSAYNAAPDYVWPRLENPRPRVSHFTWRKWVSSSRPAGFRGCLPAPALSPLPTPGLRSLTTAAQRSRQVPARVLPQRAL